MVRKKKRTSRIPCIWNVCLLGHFSVSCLLDIWTVSAFYYLVNVSNHLLPPTKWFLTSYCLVSLPPPEVHAKMVLSLLPSSLPSLINILIKNPPFLPLDLGVYVQMALTPALPPTVLPVLLIPVRLHYCIYICNYCICFPCINVPWFHCSGSAHVGAHPWFTS